MVQHRLNEEANVIEHFKKSQDAGLETERSTQKFYDSKITYSMKEE